MRRAVVVDHSVSVVVVVVVVVLGLVSFDRELRKLPSPPTATPPKFNGIPFSRMMDLRWFILTGLNLRTWGDEGGDEGVCGLGMMESSVDERRRRRELVLRNEDLGRSGWVQGNIYIPDVSSSWPSMIIL